MMLKLVIFILGLTVATAFAQEPQKKETKLFATNFPCLDSKRLFEDLTSQYGEEPIALGKGIMRSSQTDEFYKGNIILWKNEKTRSWTLTITPEGDNATTCYVLSGSEFTEVDLGVKTSF